MAGKMELLPMHRLGARETSRKRLEFGIFLPGVSAGDGVKMWVNVIHARDQYIQGVPALRYPLAHSLDPTWGDYWSAAVDLSPGSVTAVNLKDAPSANWGEPGQYLYWYSLERSSPEARLNWIVDPYAREFGTGKISAVTLGYKDHPWSENESGWKTPELRDLIVYELMLNEFAGDIPGAIAKLDYLRDLGVNCIELMPVSNVKDLINWGYSPIGYFGIDERFGNRKTFQGLVEEAHQRGIAVIVDLVYGHTSGDFAYAEIYDALGQPDPFYLKPRRGQYGPQTDFKEKLAADHFFSANHMLLDKFHVDGFRYDAVQQYYDGPTGDGYANLAYSTYQLVLSNLGKPYWSRFFKGQSVNLIQCAEYLDDPKQVLEKTYTNCAWSNRTLGLAQQIAGDPCPERIAQFGLQGFWLEGLKEDYKHNSDVVQKAPFHYLENHDHARFICNFDHGINRNDLSAEADLNCWSKLQPYLIAIFTAKGVPFLWQGQELCENYFVPPPDQPGYGRVKIFRPMRWDRFYEHAGRETIRLVRALAALRNGSDALKYGDHYFYPDMRCPDDAGECFAAQNACARKGPDQHCLDKNIRCSLDKKVMLFRRKHKNQVALVALNFGDQHQTVFVAFDEPGVYLEKIAELKDRQKMTINVNAPGQTFCLRVPSNYGVVWVQDGVRASEFRISP